MTYTIRQDHGVPFTVDDVDTVGDCFSFAREAEKILRQFYKDLRERPWILPKWSRRYEEALWDMKEKARIG